MQARALIDLSPTLRKGDLVPAKDASRLVKAKAAEWVSEDLPKAKLKKVAKKQGVKVKSRDTKADIVAKIEE